MGKGALLPFYHKRGLEEDYSNPKWKRPTAWVALIFNTLSPTSLLISLVTFLVSFYRKISKKRSARENLNARLRVR